MKQILNKQGWLVMAAALIIGLSACSNDDVVSEGPLKADGPQTISITVGAGFDEDASTRSAVVYNESAKTRTLIFTEGDRLYVQGFLGEHHVESIGDTYYSYYDYKIAGCLTMVEGSLSEDGKSAKFAGDLYLLPSKKFEYEWGIDYGYEKDEEATYDFEGKDPLSLTAETQTYLVHEDAVEYDDFYMTDSYFGFMSGWASDVNTLITTKMSVGSYDNYNAEAKSFTLYNMTGPIFNFAISGLEANTSYQIYYCGTYGSPEFPFPFENPLGNAITSDASGKVSFAIFAISYSRSHGIKFVPTNEEGWADESYGDVMMVDLGELSLDEETIYNITRKAKIKGQSIETPGDGGVW